MAQTHHLSPAAYDRLKAEYDALTTRGRVDIPRKIEVARELGDLSENGDYQAAKEEQGKLEGRIGRLSSILKSAKIVDGVTSDGTVQIGVVVELRYVGDPDIEKYLLGSIEERQPGVTVISPGSPLGEVLLGAKPGERVSYEA